MSQQYLFLSALIQGLIRVIQIVTWHVLSSIKKNFFLSRLDHHYIFSIPTKLEIQGHFLQTIKTIYTDITSQIIINGKTTHKIHIGRGVTGMHVPLCLRNNPTRTINQTKYTTEIFKIGHKSIPGNTQCNDM